MFSHFSKRGARGWNSKSEIILPGALSNQLDFSASFVLSSSPSAHYSSHSLSHLERTSFPPFLLLHRAISRVTHQRTCQHTFFLLSNHFDIADKLADFFQQHA